MSLTGAQTTKARLYLGYANLFRYKNVRLESTFTQLDSDAEAVVVQLLTDIATQDGIVQSSANQVGGIKKVDEVEFFGGNGQGMTKVDIARERGRELIGRLSTMLGVPPFEGYDYFGTAGYGGDDFSEFGMSGPTGGNGGAFQLG